MQPKWVKGCTKGAGAGDLHELKQQALTKERCFVVRYSGYPEVALSTPDVVLVSPEERLSERNNRMSSNPEPSSQVHIGNVTGGITGSIIAGRDVSNATITLGGQPTPASKEPTVDELKQLLAEVHKELADLMTQQAALKQVSPAAPFTAQGAQQSIKEVRETVDGTAGQKPQEAQSIHTRLTEATSLLSSVLDGAKTLAQKTGDVASAVKPLAEKLGPLVEKVSVAALWVGKLWL